MKTFMEEAKIYALSHQKPLTRNIQMIAMPISVLAWMILLSCVHLSIPGFFDVNLAAIATVVLLGYYFYLNWRLALVITPVFLLLWWLGGLFCGQNPTLFTVWVFLIATVIGLLTRFAGFYVEGKPPTLNHIFRTSLIAPLLIAADILFMAGWMRGLKEALYGKD